MIKDFLSTKFQLPATEFPWVMQFSGSPSRTFHKLHPKQDTYTSMKAPCKPHAPKSRKTKVVYGLYPQSVPNSSSDGACVLEQIRNIHDAIGYCAKIFSTGYPKAGSLLHKPSLHRYCFLRLIHPYFPQPASPTDQPPDLDFFFLSPTGSCSLSLPDGRRRSLSGSPVPLFPAAVVPALFLHRWCFVPMPLLVFPVHPKAAGIPFAGPFRQQHRFLASREWRFVPPGVASLSEPGNPGFRNPVRIWGRLPARQLIWDNRQRRRGRIHISSHRAFAIY